MQIGFLQWFPLSQEAGEVAAAAAEVGAGGHRLRRLVAGALDLRGALVSLHFVKIGGDIVAFVRDVHHDGAVVKVDIIYTEQISFVFS